MYIARKLPRFAALTCVLLGSIACTKPNPDWQALETGDVGTTSTSTTGASNESDTGPVPTDIGDTGSSDTGTETSDDSTETSGTGPVCAVTSIGTALCAACVEDSCCTQLSACLAETHCECLYECLSFGAGDPLDCMLQCVDTTVELPSLVALRGCIDLACHDECA